MMKKSVLIAALGLFSLNTMARLYYRKRKPDYVHQEPEPFQYVLELLQPRFPGKRAVAHGQRRIRPFRDVRRTPHHGRPRTELRTLSRRQFFLTGRKFL